MKRKTIHIIVLFLLMLPVGALQAQVDKGVTRTGKAVDCLTLDPSVDKTVSERGKIVTHPRVTRNGKIIKTGCCPTLEENSLTDTVTCVSVSMAATISDGTASTAVLQVFSDAAYNTQVGSDIPATVTEGKITAQALNLDCHTRYYFRLKLNGLCNYDWTDSTRDLTMGKATFCTVANARTTKFSATDSSREHKYNGLDTQIDSVYDHQGNAYGVVQIGDQCWLKENMRCTTSPKNYLEAGSGDFVYYPRYYLPGTASVAKCGYLYNWAGAIDVEDGSAVLSLPANHRGICPAGWHVPDTTEWIALRNTLVGSSTSYHYYDGYDYYADNTPIATILAGSCDWKIADDPSNKPGDYANSLRNSTCFNLTPTPYAGLNLVPCPNYFSEGSYNEEGKSCYLWSANSLTDGKAACLSLHYSQTGFGIGRTDNDGTPYKQAGRNVRCVRDVECDFVPKTSCDVSDGLSNEHLSATSAIDSVYDHQGNAYGVVQIGDQCWLKENMRATTSPSTGERILKNMVANNTVRYASWYNNDSLQYSEYGVLYNWCAAVDVSGSVNTLPAGNCRGICPEGWHVPTTQEWDTLVNTVVTDPYYNTSEQVSSTQYAVLLAGGCGWNGDGGTGWTPNSTSNPYRNITGFSVLPAGYYDFDPKFAELGNRAIFWSATSITAEYANRRELFYNSAVIGNPYNPDKRNGYSVRCVRNTPASATISFHANGGSGTMEAMSVMTMTETALDSNTFTHGTNFEFAGWNTKIDGTGTAYADGGNIVPTESITLYAQWNTYCTGMPRLNERGDGRVDTIIDHEGNSYEVVQVGSQCWTRKNISTRTSPSTGELLVSSTQQSTNNARKAAWFKNDSARYAQGGLLYNWNAIVDYAEPSSCDFVWYDNHQGLCPEGWHAFTSAEWQVLTNFTTASELLVRTCGGPTTTSTADDTKWLYKSANGYPGSLNDPRRNSTGLSFIPTGHYSSYNNQFALEGSMHFFSADQTSADNAYFYHIDPAQTTITTGNEAKNDYHACRCIRDGLTTFSEITIDSLNCAYVSFHTTLHNGKNVDVKTAGASSHADYIKNKVNGVVDSTSVVSGDTIIYAHISFNTDNCGNTFYIYLQVQDGVDKQLYSVRKEITLADLEVKRAGSCTVTSLNPGQDLGGGKFANKEWSADVVAPFQLDSVSDHEGNVYRVIDMGGACWLKENMRARTQIDGTDIFSDAVYNNTSEGQKAYINTTNNGDPDFYEKYGYLYNWIAAMNLSSNYNNTLNNPEQQHRGICPEGWHIPTIAEVNAMASYAINSCKPITNDQNPNPAFTNTPGGNWYANNTYVGQILSGGCDWKNCSSGKIVNPTKPFFNLSGFSWLPARSVDNGTRQEVGLYATLWTASEYNATQAWYNATSSQSAGIEFRPANKYGNARSVRCVRDVECEHTRATSCNVSVRLLNEHQSATGVIDSVYDHQGNDYGVVQIGDQCWLKENMRCTTSPRQEQTMGTKTMKLVLQSNASTYSNYVPYYYDYSITTGSAPQSVTDLRDRGYLYNWSAAVDTVTASAINKSFVGHRGICPKGWHLPTDNEWWQLEKTALTGFNTGDSTRAGSYRGEGVDKLTGGCSWIFNGAYETVPGNYYYADRNSTGFTALPVGVCDEALKLSGTNVSFWSSTSENGNNAFRRYMDFEKKGVFRSGAGKYGGFSVRCVRDTAPSVTISFDANGGSGTMTPMSVDAMANTALKSNAFTHSGNFVFAGWSTEKCSTDITYTDGATINPTGDLTLYAQWHTYCTGSPTGGESGIGRIDSVKDHQNNWYKVVQIGAQCWLKENMRATTNLSGTSILKNSSEGTSDSESRAYYYNNNNSNLRKYGCLYNFPAANNICPSGWHIPSAEDWISLANSAQVQLLYYGTANYTSYTNGLGKLTGGCDWGENNICTCPGGTCPCNYTYSDRNCTGFTAIPAGYLDGNNSGFLSRNEVTNFWGCLNNGPLAFHFSKAWEYIYAANQFSNPGYSVRCVRNN